MNAPRRTVRLPLLLAALLLSLASRASAQPSPLPPITEATILQWIQADLEKVPEKDRPFTRYLSTAHLYNAAVYAKELFDAEIAKRKPTGRLWASFYPAAGGFNFLPSSALLDEQFKKELTRDLANHSRALSGLLNSLSWGKQIARPHVVVPSQGTLFRINLQHYRDSEGQPWTSGWWDKVLRRYPYGVTFPGNAAAKAVTTATGCQVPYVKADWFAFAVSRPPLYHDPRAQTQGGRGGELPVRQSGSGRHRRDLLFLQLALAQQPPSGAARPGGGGGGAVLLEELRLRGQQRRARQRPAFDSLRTSDDRRVPRPIPP
jgi:hypothetical protein